MISSVDLEQLPGLWPSCSANKQPGINWLSIPSTWASSFLVKCCCRLHMTTPCKYIQMQSPCSACRFMHPIKASFSLWAELQCSRKSSKPRQRTEVVSPVQDSSLRPVLEQRHWSEKPPKSAPFAKPQWSWVRPTNWEGYTGTTCDLHRFQRPVQRGGAEFEPDQFHHKSKVRQLQDQSKEIKYLHNQTQVYVIILSYPILYIWYESYVTSLYHHRGLSEDRDTPNSNELTMLNWDPYQNNWNSYWILT